MNTMTKKNTFLPGIRFEVVDVTPEVANGWLEKNFENNRSVNRAAVLRFAADMASGAWRLTHQGIAFDESGRMIDGQHRCHAVVASGSTVRMVVSYYMGTSPLEKIDRGTARTMGAVLEVSGEFSRGHGKSVAATINAMDAALSGNAHPKLCIEKMREIYAHHRDGIDVAAAHLRAARFTAPFAAALAYVYPIDPAQMEALFVKAANGDQLKMYSGAWHLNRLLLGSRSQTRTQRVESARAAVKCAFLHAKDREVKILRVASGESFDAMEWAGRERERLGLCAGISG